MTPNLCVCESEVPTHVTRLDLDPPSGSSAGDCFMSTKSIYALLRIEPLDGDFCQVDSVPKILLLPV